MWKLSSPHTASADVAHLLYELEDLRVLVSAWCDDTLVPTAIQAWIGPCMAPASATKSLLTSSLCTKL